MRHLRAQRRAAARAQDLEASRLQEEAAETAAAETAAAETAAAESAATFHRGRQVTSADASCLRDGTVVECCGQWGHVQNL